MTTISQPLALWRPAQPTPWQRFRKHPALAIAQWLYRQRPALVASGVSNDGIAVVCISDTHNSTPDVPDGDLLLHAGDLSTRGSFEEIQAQLDWLNTLPHLHKVVIAGNHDLLLDSNFIARSPDRIYEGEGAARADLIWGDVIYLNNSSTRLTFPNGREITIYGSPWTPMFGNWAFQYPDIRPVWSKLVPSGVDILLTHGPPKGHLDSQGKGCPQLLREIWRARPRLVVFGHIHIGRGAEHVAFDAVQKAYDGIIAGDRGIFAALGMIFWLAWGRVRHLISTNPVEGKTTLVNAAVVGAVGHIEHNGTSIML